MPFYVVVTGIPASGKTTLAAELARGLRFDHLDKDTFLDELLAREGTITAGRRHELSRSADAMLREQAAAKSFAVLSSWWRHPASREDSGTDTGWLRQEGTQVIEIRCACPADIAVGRFSARRRHSGHLDALRTRQSLLIQLTEAERHGPLFPGPVLTCDTGSPVPAEVLAELVASIRVRLATRTIPDPSRGLPRSGNEP